MNTIYMYALKFENKYMYIGSTNNCKRRFKEHLKKMSENKHSSKVLNGHQNEVEMIELGRCEDNSFTRMIIEGCFNSIYQPRNGNVLQQGLQKISVQRLEINDGISILKSLESNDKFEFLEEIDLSKSSKENKKNFGRKALTK